VLSTRDGARPRERPSVTVVDSGENEPLVNVVQAVTITFAAATSERRT
jgi:hypothetical protein